MINCFKHSPKNITEQVKRTAAWVGNLASCLKAWDLAVLEFGTNSSFGIWKHHD